MAEIRCPMCGKPNPDNLDICQFCQARLKPLLAPSEESIIPDQSTSDSELPDWFVDSESDFGDTTDDTPFELEDDADDWMTRLGGDSEPKESSLPQADPDAEIIPDSRMDFDNNGVPDWLEDMDADRTTPPLVASQESADAELPARLFGEEESKTPESIEASSDLPDWLSGLGSQEEDAPIGDAPEDDTPSSAPIPPFAADEDDLPDWLTAGSDDEAGPLSGAEEMPPLEETIPLQEHKSVVSEGDGELPDWLAADDESETSGAIPSDEGDLVDDASGYIGQETIPIKDYFESDEAAPVLGAEDADLPDWLSDSAEESESIPSAADGDLLERLSGIEDEVEAPSLDGEAPALGTEDADLPDWLSDSAEESEDLTSAVPEGDLPEWLSGMDGVDDASPEDETPALGAEDADLPDWLSDDAEESESIPSAAEGDLPEWLSGMDEVEAPSLDGETPSLGAEDADVPDWLADFSAQEEAQTEEAPKPQKPFDIDTGALYGLLAEDSDDLESTPAVASDLPEQQPDLEPQVPSITDASPQQEQLPALGETDDESLPDWLSGEDESESAVPSTAAEGELPDWLADFDEQEEAPTEAVDQLPEADSSFAAESDLPDWLSEGSEAAEESVASATDRDGDLPDWLTAEKASDIALAAGVAKAVGEISESSDLLADRDDEIESAAPSAAESEVPDWLSGIEGVETSASEEAVSTFADQEEVPDWLSDIDTGAVEADPSVEEDLPDWLSDINGVEEMPESEPDLSPTSADESRAVPDWLHEPEISLPAADDDIEAAPVVAAHLDIDDDFDDDLLEMDSLADWIADEPQDEIDQAQEKTGPFDGLEPAELPGWLAAMRPVESAASDAAGAEKRGPMENAGPLAGLYGVLAAEPDISRLKKPPVYSSKLQITDAQQSHANVLQELLEAESQPLALPLPPLLSSQRVYRIILSTIMLVIAFVAVLAGSEIAAMPSPGNIPPGVEKTRDLVNSLTQDDTALIAFDYEPGLAGEMDTTSAAVVDHMMLKGAKLVLVSTSPTGPALAERFISNVQGTHGYVSGSQYVNLGYVPGGVTGLGAFARTPQWVFPDTLNGAPAWETEPLKNIREISDFALVVLITDNPNTARAWVEQVNPELDAVPLVALVSAQAEPMVRPYFDNQQNQIDGLVSGLTGGAAYEVVTRPNVARTYWDAFNIVLIVAVSAILIGGFITVVSTLLAQRKESEGDSA